MSVKWKPPACGSLEEPQMHSFVYAEEKSSHNKGLHTIWVYLNKNFRKMQINLSWQKSRSVVAWKGQGQKEQKGEITNGEQGNCWVWQNVHCLDLGDGTYIHEQW